MFCFLEYICSTLFSVLGRTAVQGNIRCHAWSWRKTYSIVKYGQ
jgi:hypothetical protein